MRSITLSSGEEYGTNDHDGGVFRRAQDGTWAQCAGNSETPMFQTPQQFRDYLHTHFAVRGVRIVATHWGTS